MSKINDEMVFYSQMAKLIRQCGYRKIKIDISEKEVIFLFTQCIEQPMLEFISDTVDLDIGFTIPLDITNTSITIKHANQMKMTNESLIKIIDYIIKYKMYTVDNIEGFINELKRPIETFLAEHPYAKKLSKNGITICLPHKVYEEDITSLESTNWKIMVLCTQDGQEHQMTHTTNNGLSITEVGKTITTAKDVYYILEGYCQLVNDCKLVSKSLEIHKV